MRINILSGGEV